MFMTFIMLNVYMLNVAMLSVFIFYCHYVEFFVLNIMEIFYEVRHYSESYFSDFVMLSIFILSVITMTVTIFSVVVAIVVAPFQGISSEQSFTRQQSNKFDVTSTCD
jgi:uncharacterized protein involved in cysteine biosynthesis